jgi:non-homologous end joining protein Ku
VLRGIIEAKAEGKEVAAPATSERPRVVDLTKALEQSLKDRPLARAGGRRARASGRAPKGRKAA